MSGDESNVIELAAHRPHMHGRATCLACRHGWQAVAPIGTWRLECPECKLCSGVWSNPVEPEDGTLRGACNCGSQVFHLLLCDNVTMARCSYCGEDFGG